MSYCYHTVVPVEPPRDIVVTLRINRAAIRYYTDTRVQVVPPRDTVMTLE